MTRQYHAYLLRLWQESAESDWRITLENAQTHNRQTFDDLQAVIDHLQIHTANKGDTSCDQFNPHEVNPLKGSS